MSIDFSGKDLRGRSFRGKYLVDANFSGADIRGVNFSGANLAGANFSQVRAGVPLFWRTCTLFFSGLLLALVGVLSGVSSVFIARWFPSMMAHWLGIGVLVLLLLLAYKKGLWTVLWVEGIVCAIALALSWIVQTALNSGTLVGTASPELLESSQRLLDTSAVVVVAVSVMSLLVWMVATAAITAAALVSSGLLGSAIAILFFGLVALSVASTLAGQTAVTWVFVAVLLGALLARLSFSSNNPLDPIRAGAIRWSTIGGTRFHKANLANADFTRANLTGTDLTKANVMQTCWYQTRGLDRARIQCPILNNPKLRDLLVSKRGRHGNFAGMSLLGINLENADLQAANLYATNLFRANLRNANLRSANLGCCNLKEADLQGTKMEGAELQGANLEGTILDL